MNLNHRNFTFLCNFLLWGHIGSAILNRLSYIVKREVVIYDCNLFRFEIEFYRLAVITFGIHSLLQFQHLCVKELELASDRGHHILDFSQNLLFSIFHKSLFIYICKR